MLDNFGTRSGLQVGRVALSEQLQDEDVPTKLFFFNDRSGWLGPVALPTAVGVELYLGESVLYVLWSDGSPGEPPTVSMYSLSDGALICENKVDNFAQYGDRNLITDDSGMYFLTARGVLNIPGVTNYWIMYNDAYWSWD